MLYYKNNKYTVFDYGKNKEIQLDDYFSIENPISIIYNTCLFYTVFAILDDHNKIHFYHCNESINSKPKYSTITMQHGIKLNKILRTGFTFKIWCFGELKGIFSVYMVNLTNFEISDGLSVRNVNKYRPINYNKILILLNDNKVLCMDTYLQFMDYSKQFKLQLDDPYHNIMYILFIEKLYIKNIIMTL